MTGRLQGKTTIITGGASGMGRSTVNRFLEEGANVVIGDLNQNNGEAALKELQDRGYRDSCRFVPTDVTKESDIEQLVATAEDEFGGLDCIFNNAGVGGAFGPIGETAVEDWDFTFHVLVRGVFLGIKHASNVMRRQNHGGSIISTASIAALSGGAGSHAYSSAKAAVATLTQSAAVELSDSAIRVNAIAPGIIVTPLFLGDREDKMLDVAQNAQPWPRLGNGDDIANMALFLASDESEFISGQMMVVDGGLTAKGPNLWGTGRSNLFTRKVGVNRGSTGVASSINPIRRP